MTGVTILNERKIERYKNRSIFFILSLGGKSGKKRLIFPAFLYSRLFSCNMLYKFIFWGKIVKCKLLTIPQKRVKKLKRIVAFCSALIILLMLASCSGNSETVSDPSWERVHDEKKLLVGVDAGSYPMVFESDGGLIGFDVDLIQEVCKRLDVTLEWVQVSAADAQQLLEDGTIDCMWSGYAYTASRDEEMTLSTPYAKVRQVLVVKQDAAFQNIADLSGAAMGVVEGSAAQAAMDGTEEFSASLQGITLFGTVEELVSALEAGTVQVAAMDETAARYSILQGKAFRMISTSSGEPEEVSETDMVIAFAWGSDSLCAKIQETLATIVRDDVFTTLSQKWFGYTLESGLAS